MLIYIFYLNPGSFAAITPFSPESISIAKNIYENITMLERVASVLTDSLYQKK